MYGPIRKAIGIEGSPAAGDLYWDDVVWLTSLDNELTSETDNSAYAALYSGAAFSDAQSKFGTHSVYLNGVNSFLGLESGRDVLADEQFTIEGWVHPTVDLTYEVFFGTTSAPSAGTSGIFHTGVFCSGSRIIAQIARSIEIDVNVGSVSSIIPTNQWSHIALTRDYFNNVRLFVNGVLIGEVLKNSAFPSTAMRWGRNPDNIVSYGKFTGYVDELRVTYGACRYIEDFALPSEPFPNTLEVAPPATDPYWNNVTLLLPFDGTTGDTSTTDISSANTPVTFYDTAQLTDSVVKFGPTSMYFDGASHLRVDDALSTLTSTTDPFTIEFWAYPTTAGGTGSSADFFIGINKASDSSSVLLLGPRQIVMGATTATYNGGFAALQWWHFAYTYDGSHHRVYKNSKLLYQRTGLPLTTPPSECVFGIGAEFDAPDGGVSGNWFNGYIDELRVTAGVARYTGNLAYIIDPYPTS